MKKIISLFVLSFLFAVPMYIGAQTPQFYNSNTGSGTNTYPFGQTGGQRVHFMIRPGTLNQPSQCPAGNITSLFFFMGNTATGTFTNLTIRLGQTALTSLPSGWYTGQMDTVYFRASVTLSCTNNAWMTITLDRPFTYDPAQSLIIDISQCATTAGLYVHEGSGTCCTRNYGSPGGGCNISYAGQDGEIINFGVNLVPSNCGYVWAPQTSGTTNGLNSVKAVSNLVAWTGGDAATVRVTTNGGILWNNGNPNPGVINGSIYALDAFDANLAWCTTSPAATFIYRTTNGGVNWTQVFTQTGGFIDDIKFIDANTGYAVGDPVGARWTIFKSVNGGATWDSSGLYLPQAGSEAGWNNASFVIGNTIWVGTSNTRIYKSTNFGATGSWTFGTTTGQANSYSLHFNSPLLGLMGGTGALRTTDGGATWTSVTTLGSGNITALEGFGTNFWYTRGTGIYRSTDSGNNWTSSFTAAGGLLDIDLWGSTGCLQGWAVGATGTIVRMTGDTLVGIGNNHNQIPSTYSLEQNYPNPFNPSTKISFALPKTGLVELKVYDVLGRETATLINEVRQAGNYSIEFDASTLASGVYFYTLKSADFTDTKKMLLIK